MKNLKRFAAVAVAVALLTVAGAAFAAEFKTPAEVVSGLTGKTVEALKAERTAGKTYGTIANESGKLDEFKAQMLEQKKAILDQSVLDGKLTQAKADEIYAAIKANMATCDGSGSAGIGKRNGAGFGSGAGCSEGKQAGKGMGMGRNGMGRGMGSGRR